MNLFLMHVGHNNMIDMDYTIKRQRTIDEMLEALPEGDQRRFFATDSNLQRSFPDGRFHCWGVPIRARPAFERTRIGDLVLFAPWVGIHGGGISHIGIVRAMFDGEANESSRVLWPKTPEQRLFPWIFFFHAVPGFRDWYAFLDDAGISHRWHPHGWYRRIDSTRFQHFGGVQKYHEFLLASGGFSQDGDG